MLVIFFRNNIPAKSGINHVALNEITRLMDKHESLPFYITLDEMKSKF